MDPGVFRVNLSVDACFVDAFEQSISGTTCFLASTAQEVCCYINVGSGYLLTFFAYAASTHDQDVFSFNPEERCCNGIKEALSRYKEILPHLMLAGDEIFYTIFNNPAYYFSFSVRPHLPVIEKAMTIVEESKGQYHVLVIIADGQVTPREKPRSKKENLTRPASSEQLHQQHSLPVAVGWFDEYRERQWF
ncbi:copine [Artemisia annua]|uniref:Copine n=1 Tax=Artemisia annua TaxID=35608 RepID=A0A2U1NLJ9_ARTAN|nr:copine [Artemisia annua]